MIKPARTEAILPGTIGGDGKAATYSFQWGESEALGQSTPAHSAGSGEEKVEATLSGLEAGTHLLLPPDRRKRKRGQLRPDPRIPDATGGRSPQHGPDQGPSARKRDPDGQTDPGRLRRALLLPVGHDRQLRQQQPDPSGHRRRRGRGALEKRPSWALSRRPNTLFHYRLVAENSFGGTYGRTRRSRRRPTEDHKRTDQGIGQEEAATGEGQP